jgi:hypothetical protein
MHWAKNRNMSVMVTSSRAPIKMVEQEKSNTQPTPFYKVGAIVHYNSFANCTELTYLLRACGRLLHEAKGTNVTNFCPFLLLEKSPYHQVFSPQVLISNLVKEQLFRFHMTEKGEAR